LRWTSASFGSAELAARKRDEHGRVPLLVDASHDIPFIVRSEAEGHAAAQRVVVSKCRFIDYLELLIGP
jgi:hypothetical protein